MSCHALSLALNQGWTPDKHIRGVTDWGKDSRQYYFAPSNLPRENSPSAAGDLSAIDQPALSRSIFFNSS